jgi:hypothetical protein
MTPRVNEELIDNLVCGSLRGAEYRKAVLALEADPQKWRDCALAFLQEQALTQELSQLSQSSVEWQESNFKTHSNSNQVSVVERNLVVASSPTSSADQLGWLYKLGSLAALLLLSFSVGWIGSSIRDHSALGNQKEPTDTSLVTASNPKVDQVVDRVLPMNEFGSNNFSYVGNNSTSLLPIDERIPENLAKLERDGRIRIEKTTAIMPVECESGTMLVPVQQIRIVPVTFSY